MPFLRNDLIKRLNPQAGSHGIFALRRSHFVSFEAKWERTNAVLGRLGRCSKGSMVSVYHEPGAAFEAMWEAVRKAKHNVRWQTYICKDDAVGKKTLALLEDACKRGVQVELLYDCCGNISGRQQLTAQLSALGATVIPYKPFWVHVWPYLFSGFLWHNSPGLRNHRKILIVDGSVAFAGGLNIGDDYCSAASGGNGRFRDTHCCVTGPAVHHLEEVYEDTKTPISYISPFVRWRHIMGRYIARQREVGKEGLDRVALQFKERVAQAKHIGRLSMQKISRRRQRQYQWKFKRVAPAPPKYAVRLRRAIKSLSNEGRNFRRRLRQQRFVLRERLRQSMVSRLSATWKTTSLQDTKHKMHAASIHFSRFPPITQILMCNPNSRDWSIQIAMAYAVRRACSRIWVTTPYYMPHRKLTNAVISAAKRGLDVRILAGSAKTTDPWFMWYASQYLTMRLLRAGVRIYEYEGGQIMHAKTVVIDSVWSSVGSYNWDVLSNKLLEVCVVQFGPHMGQEMEKQFLLDLSHSHELTIETFDRRPWFQRVTSLVMYHCMKLAELVCYLRYQDADLTSRLD